MSRETQFHSFDDEFENDLADAEVLVREVTHPKLESTMRCMVHQVMESASASKRRVLELHKRHPYQSLLFSALAGVLLGLLLGRSTKC